MNIDQKKILLLLTINFCVFFLIISKVFNDNCIVETVGEFDSRCSFKLKNDGLHWELEEEEEDWDDEEGW